jgi:5-methyltetrahydrofolate--homocysteine methyltransferase
MPIDFGPERWEKAREAAEAFWEGTLDRPLLNLTAPGGEPGRPEPELPGYGITAQYGFDVPAEDIVDRWDYDLSKKQYLADAFPHVWPNFGAGVLAAGLGCNVGCDGTTCWFYPEVKKEAAELSLRDVDLEGGYMRRIQDLCEAAQDHWQGAVQVAMTDLGGPVDIVSAFRPGQGLLMDLYDHPEEVKRLTWEVHEAWWDSFEAIDAKLQPANPGYTCWTPILSATPYYMLQSDFAFMIGPEMFDEFVKPEVEASAKKLGRSFYHLDGVGQLPHLDSLLAIEELDGIQWIPGAGHPDNEHWPEVYRKVHEAGKLSQVFCDLRTLDLIAEQIGTAKGITIIGQVNDQAEIDAFLKKWG